ncbi:ACT domain-containing protein [Clostridium thermobutyricum]|uniref:Uncharacterized protein n=1 Tax=Clostridium thermobutyricum TaxID=29372 RepID=N9Y126_9CLOT|nr:ACT domain-containing protein [Clostridium thermobutyricum]ENZ01854.1 hypothetical protein HMPREF1092_01088 [Clostridium thermobutyricum]
MNNKKLSLTLLKEKYCVCRLNKDDEIPSWVLKGEFYSITRTEDELSIVCVQDNLKSKIKCEKNWKILKIDGPLDFSLIGILSKISVLMAENEISIFVVSTYDTDYILIKEKNLEKAIDILKNDNYKVIR